METINRCREISADKRAELDEHEHKNRELIKMRELYALWSKAPLSSGNRKERRRQAALERQR